MRLFFLLASLSLSNAVGSVIKQSLYHEMLGFLEEKGLMHLENYLTRLSEGNWIGRINLYLDSYLNGSKRGEDMQGLMEKISDDMAKGLPYSQKLHMIKPFPDNNGLGISIQMLDAYLYRIDYKLNGEKYSPTKEVLDELILHHAFNIPVETAQMTLLNSNISLDIDSIFRHLVYDRRGGDCYQRNLLLAAVLSKLGFDVRLGNAWLSKRNEDGSYSFAPKPSHAILFVHGLVDNILLVDTTIWNSYTKSIPVYNGATVVNNYGVTSTIRQSETDNSLFQLFENERVLYSFTANEFTVTDYLPDNVRIRNDSKHFLNRHLIFTRITPEGTARLVDGRIITVIDGVKQVKEIQSMVEMKKLLANLFGIILTEKEITLVENRLFQKK